MKRFGISGLALTLALGAGSGLHAQDEGESTAPAETGSIVDENADGIDDTMARQHRGRRGRGPGMGQGRGNGPQFGGVGAALTAEQQEALKATVDELKTAGATREEIHAAVGEKLESFGVELPEDWAERPTLGQGDGQGNGKGKAKGVRGRGRHGRGPGRRGTPAPAPAPAAEPEQDSGF